jgi:two-component system chemotaxis response regulator CheB
MAETLRVLVVDDSPTARTLLVHAVNSAPDMQVVGEGRDGRQAVRMARSLHPDVILMDVIMPEMDGLDATREIMYTTPTPIVLISASLEEKETEVAFQAMSLGALAVNRKPDGPAHPDHDFQVEQLLNRVRLMARVHVIRHYRNREVPVEEPYPTTDIQGPLTAPELIAIVSSTGGPAALAEIVQVLPPGFSIPLVIVQHISADFVQSLANWMSHITALRVEIAQPGGRPEPGVIYLAPDKAHLKLTRYHQFELDPNPGSYRHFPAGDVLLESVAESYRERAMGVVLTGIGEDGARGLRSMAELGAFTVAQDEATSVVYGMPKAAAAMGAARQILSLPDIAQLIKCLHKETCS